MMRLLPTILLSFTVGCGDGIADPPIVDPRVVVDTVYLTVTDTLILTDTVTVSDTVLVTDTLTVSDTVRVTDTVQVVVPVEDADTLQLQGALAWGGGPVIESSAHLAARLPDGRWGIGTSTPMARLHIEGGEFRLGYGTFRMRISGDWIGDDPAGVGITLDRDANQGDRNMGLNLQQAGVNLWGLGLDADTQDPFPDYVSVFQSGQGDIFRFRAGGRAALGNGVSRPEPHHVLTVVDRENDYIENVLNLHMSPDGNGRRYIRAFDSNGIPFAVGEGGHTGVRRDYSPDYALAVAGEVEARKYVTYSDARLKEDVRPMDEVLPSLRRLVPVLFRWKEASAAANGTQMGLIAQEVEEVFPDLVHQDAEGIRTVDYDALGVLLLKAVQEIAERLDEPKR